MTSIFKAAAYGGEGWSPRTASLRQEIGGVWGACGVGLEWSLLKAVLLHRPGPELEEVADPDAAQMLAPLDADRARKQHDALAQAYRDAGVTVHYDHRGARSALFECGAQSLELELAAHEGGGLCAAGVSRLPFEVCVRGRDAEPPQNLMSSRAVGGVAAQQLDTERIQVFG